MTAPRFLSQAAAWMAARSPRERALIAVMALMCASAVTVRAVENVLDAHADAVALTTERAMGEQRRAAQRNAAFVEAAGRAARDARQASVGGETIHLARARAQADVEDLAEAAGLAGVSAAVQPRPKAAKGAARGQAVTEDIVIHLTADYDDAAFARFLQALSESGVSLAPISHTVIRGQNARLDMRIVAYAVRTETAA